MQNSGCFECPDRILPEPFKNQFSRALIDSMGDRFARIWPAFDRSGFTTAAADKLETLELKQRSNQIAAALARFLPGDFERAAAILRQSLTPDPDSDKRGIDGWAIMPISHYVGTSGLGHFALSMDLLKEMTNRFSAEFGIRFLILEDSERALSIMKEWTRDPDHHVRRLVSEGTRPRLPWAMQLPGFIEDPAPILPLLERLKDDESEYVRRSVANNLNDIAKDHPDRVADIAGRWLQNAGEERRKLVRHACRTLVKQGHRKALTVLGYGPPKLELKGFALQTPDVEFGEALSFEVSLTSTAKRPQALILDYVIHHRKANGDTSPKVFKWKTLTLDKQARHTARRRHVFRPITTRTYYPGTHALELLINGVSFCRHEFELTMQHVES